VDYYPLLDWLAALTDEPKPQFQDWTVTPVRWGHNNRLYRATCDETDVAVKFYRIDARDRAGREFESLKALQTTGLEIAPRALLLDRQRYSQPVTVQTWMSGEMREGPPENAQEWARLVDHYADCQSVTPQKSGVVLPEAVLTCQSAAEGVQKITSELLAFPVDARRAETLALIGRMQETRFPTWPEPELCLNRCDPSPGNLLRRDGPWVSVDWEYAGWGDAGFEIGDLMTHPNYFEVSREEWDNFLAQLGSRRPHDSTFPQRAWVYYAICLVRWTGVFSRIWHQRDAGLIDRARWRNYSPEWWASLPDRYEMYRSRAVEELHQWNF